MKKHEFEALAKKIFMAALEVHKRLGPGLLESVYEYALIMELELMGVHVQYQVPVPLYYRGFDTGKQFFIDILVEGEIVIEVKACEALTPVYDAQLLSYLKLADKKLGFLINFNVPMIKEGFKRKVNNYFLEEPEAPRAS